MPIKAIKALPNTEVSISGKIIQAVAARERKVIKHMLITALYTAISIIISEAEITSLVAASITALPAANKNWYSSVLFFAANSSTAATAVLSVSALWSSKNTNKGASEQSELYRESALAMELLRMCWLRDKVSHFRLPSFMPLITCLDTVTMEITDCTPGVFSMRQLKSSMALMAP